MIAPSLPPALAAALDARMQGMSRGDAASRSAAISQTYRSGGGSGGIRSETDALAYALARMPATYAAVAASLNALRETMPDFAPASLLDCGAGPGTATWAATQAFASLTHRTALDANAALRTLALGLAHDTGMTSLRYTHGDLLASLAAADSADLIIASYVLNEFNADAQMRLADAMWQKTDGVLLIVEPGTPAGYQNILALRARLIAQGAHVMTPCPHDQPCPLTAPDWCHFSQRLPRSRAHKQLKTADAPFEDERFSYVALSRAAVAARPARILTQPALTKVAVTARLCARNGIAEIAVPRRDKAAYAAARRWRWGDAIADRG